MTTFDQLQAGHQQLLDELSAPADAAAFLIRVRAYIDHVCEAAQDVPAPRDRDQLRANLRFWASYVYDQSGVYPRTMLRPASASAESAFTATQPQPTAAPAAPEAADADDTGQFTTPRSVPVGSSTTARPLYSPVPARRARAPLWIAVVGGVALIVVVLVLAISATGAIAPTQPQVITPQPATGGNPALNVEAREITSGPSPFDAQVWVARMKLVGRGGNGDYIFWVDGVRLPDVTRDEFTVEGKGCGTERHAIGITSGGAATNTIVEVKSPLTGCP